MPAGKENWYNNKEIYEMMLGLRDDLQATQVKVEKYNHLVDKLTEVGSKVDVQIKRCDEVQATWAGRKGAADTVRHWWPLILSTIIFILAILKVID